MSTFDDYLARQRADRERRVAEGRKRCTLFALESVAGDGLPRVSSYTVDTLVSQGLMEWIPGDNLNRLKLTPEGRIMLAANPTEEPASDELALFGTLS